MLETPRYPRSVITQPIDDVVVKDVGKEVVVVVWTVVVVEDCHVLVVDKDVQPEPA